MESYTVTIIDPTLVAGIAAARAAYNANLPEDGVPFETNEEYVQFVMSRAAESYANSYKTQA